MEEFLSWAGWTGVSAFAQLVALVTLVGAAWRYILRRREFPAVLFRWDVIGTLTLRDRGTFHVVEFHNIGHAPALITMMHFSGGRPELNGEHRAPAVLGAGGSFQLLVSSERLEACWFRLFWQTGTDRRAVHVIWGAIVSDGEMDSQYDADLERLADRPLWARLKAWWRGEMVAPGHAVRATVRKGTRLAARARRVVEAPEGSGPWTSAKATGDSVEDLPYVPSPEAS